MWVAVGFGGVPASLEHRYEGPEGKKVGNHCSRILATD